MAVGVSVKVREKTSRELVAMMLPQGFQLDWQGDPGEIHSPFVAVQDALLFQFQEDEDRAFLHLGFLDPHWPWSGSLRFVHAVAEQFLTDLARIPDLEDLREQARVDWEDGTADSLLAMAPVGWGSEFLTPAWIAQSLTRLQAAFATEIRAYPGSVEEFFATRSQQLHPVGRVFFHLVESKKEDFPFAFMATYSSDTRNEGKSRHLPLKNALIEYQGDQAALLGLLSTVNKAAAQSPFIAGLVESGEIFHPLRLSAQETYEFLKEVPLYEQAGILCRIPQWWKKSSRLPKLAVNIGTQPPSILGRDALLNFDVRLSLGEDALNPEELQELLRQEEGLAFLKGKWVEVDHDKLQKLLEAYERARKMSGRGPVDILGALRFELEASRMAGGREDDVQVEVSHGEWLRTVLGQLSHPTAEDAPDLVDGALHADLREYQRQGVAWLRSMRRLGLGACLADDMGLGKTLQVLALLSAMHQEGPLKALLLVPASLIGNWVDEMAKFTPRLPVWVLHPSEHSLRSVSVEQIGERWGVFLTTYGMAGKFPELTDLVWDVLILDEAQAIKNPATHQARAVKRIPAQCKIAMTGTPIENRLSDLWSLFDFLNQGLLGTAKEFTAYTKQLSAHPEGYAPLKRVVSPFILRRLKTDRTVISDLPDKIEMRSFAALTKKQAALYRDLAGDVREKLESAEEGIARRGLILSSIMKFKQICNHPDQYLGQGTFDPRDSGKFERLAEICETIYAKRERVLVFTQFKEMTGPLQEFLETVFHHPGLTLHGQTPVAKRRALVAQFQGAGYVPFMVLSIKAGGVGLNLTRANHAIHFDRWWNPAVENQATDRAFRIGQEKNVVVHKFITRGTIEEKIDMLIQEKLQLSQDIVPDQQENWIGDLDNRQLMDLFRLSV